MLDRENSNYYLLTCGSTVKIDCSVSQTPPITISKLAIAAVISSVVPTVIKPDPPAPSVIGLSLTIINQTF